MPCLILTGLPSSGKSTFANLLSQAAIKHPSNKISSAIVINEESIPSLSNYKNKNDYYENSKSEKSTRSALRSTFDKYCHSCKSNDNNTLIILDSLNYIKGFRYELHCISKSVSDLHGVVWVQTPVNQCKYWNSKREDKLDNELMDGLIQRYEPPDDRNRWDKPLYRVDMSVNITSKDASTKNDEEDVLKKSVYNMHCIKEALQEKNTESPAQDATNTSILEEHDSAISKVINEILDHFLTSKPLKQGQSTKSIIPSESNSLHNIDKVTTSFITNIQKAQQQQMIPGNISINVNEQIIKLYFHRFVSISELRRLRKSFVQLSKSQPPKDSSEFGICSSFTRYLEQQIV